jgi:excisionase family DNA binding protein
MATELLTEAEVAELLGVRPKTLARWRWKGNGPVHRKIGRKVRYARNDVED